MLSFFLTNKDEYIRLTVIILTPLSGAYYGSVTANNKNID